MPTHSPAADIAKWPRTILPKDPIKSACNPQWSPQASELLAGTRRARRRYNDTGENRDLTSYWSSQGQLKKELRRVGRANWRQFIELSTAAPDNPHEKGLWRLSRWSKLRAGKPQASPHIPPLRRSEQDISCDDNPTKAQILAEKFFPEGGQADLSDIDEEASVNHMLNISSAVTAEQVEQTINRLPNGKASGPDNISNEALKAVVPLIKKGLTRAISKCLDSGSTPGSFCESITVVLRKERKRDYSLPSSYRPIALENTIAKLMEKLVAERIACAAEAHSLLS